MSAIFFSAAILAFIGMWAIYFMIYEAFCLLTAVKVGMTDNQDVQILIFSWIQNVHSLFSISISASCCFFSSDSGLHWNLGNAFTFCRVCAHNQYKRRKIFGIFKIYFFVYKVTANGEQISEIENIYHTQSAQMEINYESSENISFLSPQFLRHKRRRTLLQ